MFACGKCLLKDCVQLNTAHSVAKSTAPNNVSQREPSSLPSSIQRG